MATEHHGPETGLTRSGERIVSLAIRNPVTVCMLFLSLVVMGVIAVQRIPLMLVPQLDAPVMYVRADYHNATPSQVLDSITKPIEEVLATVPGVQRMSSSSARNGMLIQVWCGLGAETSMIRAEMREKIEQIRDTLPEDLRQIEVRNFSTDDIPILEGTLTADHDLRTEFEFLEARVKKPLERIPGVGNVDLWGTDRKQVDIYLRLDDVKRYGVDVAQLFRTIEGSNANLSLGRVSDGGNRYSAVVRGTVESVEDIARFPVGRQNLVLSDVADVVLDQRPRNHGRHQNGSHAVGLVIQKASESNTVDTVDEVHAVFAGWLADPTMKGLAVRWWHDSGEEIRKVLSELLKAGSIGAILAMAVLFAFLRRLDASIAVGFAIPFSVLTAVGLLYFNGDTLNMMSMIGLMLAAGMLVDNAVVVLESILQKREQGQSTVEAASRGAGEVTVAVIAATSTTMIIFVPLMFDSDSQISVLLGHVGISIVFALLCSLFISLTLIPLVATKILKDLPRSDTNRGRMPRGMASAWFRPLFERLRRTTDAGGRKGIVASYLRAVDWHLDRRLAVGLVAVPAVLGLATWALTDLVPDNSPTASTVSSMRITYEFSENYHYAKVENDYVNPVERFLHANMERLKLKSTSSAYGNNWAWTRAFLDTDRAGPEDLPAIREAISEGLPVIPGARIELGREDGDDQNWINANLYGDSPAKLLELTRQARTALLASEGISEVYTSLVGATDEVQVRLRRDTARKFNVSPRTVSQVLAITVRSQRMRSYRTADGEVEIWVGIDPDDMQSVEDLKSIVVGGGQDGQEVLLGHVADLRIDKVPGQINRENRRTYSEINVSYTGARKENGQAAVKAALDTLGYEPGYGWTYGFWTRRQNEDVQDFVFNMILALVLVYFVMAALFESVLHPFAIMLSLPFSLVGIVLFLLATGTPFNAMAQVGMIILIGIVVNNGIVLINHINNLRREGLPRREAILRGCRERIRPICMTASTTIVGLVPLAWGDANLMGMNYFPLARTVMGGLMASTALTLVVLPTYYVILDDFGRWFRRLWITTDPSLGMEGAAGD